MGGLSLLLAAVVSSLPVVVERDASPSQRYAAEELSEYVGRITGRELQVKVRGEGERRRSAPCVRFVTTDEYGDDGFRLQVKDGDVVISGSRTYGCLYGVYELLETYAGCGWFSSRCEIVPKAEKVEVPDALDVVQRPAFALREPYWYDAFDGDFAARLRLNGSGMRLEARHGGHNRRFSKRLWLCHTFQKLVPPAKYFAEHPEYFSEVRGKRLKDNSQLCLSNPDVLEIVVSNVLAEIRANPGVGYVGVSQNDWGNWCTCEKCRAVDEEEGSPSGSIVRFVNAVAERVEKSYPKVRIETLAYQYSRKPPKKTRVRHNVIPCLCSIECRVSRPLAEKSCPENAAFVEDLKGWAAQAPELYVWDYTTDFACYMHPMANVKALAENIRFFRDSRVTALFAQGDYEGPHAHFAELKAWLIAKLMWNPDQDLDPLVNRFFAGYFGAAAPFARRYYDSLHALPRPPDRQLWIYESPLSDNVPDSFLEESAQTWAQAADAVRDDPVRAYNVRMASMANDAVRFWRLRGKLTPKKYQMVSDPAAYRAKYEAICRQAVPLARTLVARLDEERRIVFKEGHAADHNFPEPEIRAVAAGRDLPEPTASGDEIVFEEDAMTLTLPGVKGELADDPLAGNGKAYRLFTTHRDWCVTLKLDQVAFDDAEYVLSARVRTEQDPGVTNKAFWCGVEGGAARESTHARKVMAPEIKPGYAWYDIVTWKPANSQYIWFGPGISPMKGPKVRATYLDALRIRRVRRE